MFEDLERWLENSALSEDVKTYIRKHGPITNTAEARRVVHDPDAPAAHREVARDILATDWSS